MKSFTFSVLLLMLITANSYSMDGYSYMGSGMGIGEAGWSWYNSGDALEGAYMGWMYSGTMSLAGTVALGVSLPAGTYYVMAKIYDYDGSSAGKITFTMAGVSSAQVTTNNYDWNRRWTNPVQIITAGSDTNLVVTLIKTVPAASTQKYLLCGVYITTNAYENVVDYGYDFIKDWTYPSVMDDSPAIKGNLIQNSSFETGLNHGWGIRAQGGQRNATSSYISTAQKYHGSNSVLLPGGKTLLSRLYRTTSNKSHTLSVYAKSVSGTASVTIHIYNPNTPPTGYPEVVNLTATDASITDWERISVSGYLTEYPTNMYQISVTATADVYLDCFQLEEGSISDWAQANPTEFAFYTSAVGNVLQTDEALQVSYRAYNDSGGAYSATLRYEIYDIKNALTASGEIAADFAAGVSTGNISIAATTGIFSIRGWLLGVQNTQDELVYAMVPPPVDEAVNTASSIGIHPNLNFSLEIMQRLGMKWVRLMSPESSVSRSWDDIEVTEGNFTWQDDKVNLIDDYGMSAVATLGSGSEWPAWADNGGVPNLTKWAAYVTAVVAHYKDRIHYWEIWNEPIYRFTEAFYADLLAAAALAIYAEDATAKVVGIGGTYDSSWAETVIGELGENWSDYMDYISEHTYPTKADISSGGDLGGASQILWKTDIVDAYSIPVWNTESGAWDCGFYKMDNANYNEFGEDLWGSMDSMRFQMGNMYEAGHVLSSFFYTVGNGLSKYFYYDSRVYADPNYLRNHPTILEYDDSIRAKGVAYSIAANFFDYSVGLGNINSNTHANNYLFNKSNVPWVAVWSKDYLPHTIAISGIASLAAYDMMGNAVAVTGGTTVPVGRYPVYITGSSTVAAMQTALGTAVISDANDTIAPNISIDEFPIDLAEGSTAYFRCLAIDETDVPSSTGPTKIQYAYKMDSGAWSAWTSTNRVSYSGLLDGFHTFYAKAKDSSGNVSAEASYSFGNDTTNPVIEIASPTASPTYATGSSSLDLSGVCTDNAACSSVTWTCDLCTVVSGTASGTASWSQALTLTEGVNTIVVTGHDAAANTGTDQLVVTYTVGALGTGSRGSMRR